MREGTVWKFQEFLSLWFYVKSLLADFRSFEFWFLRISNFKMSKNPQQIQNSEPLQLFNFAVFWHQNDQNWFHVKSEWQKNTEILKWRKTAGFTNSKKFREIVGSISFFFEIRRFHEKFCLDGTLSYLFV